MTAADVKQVLSFRPAGREEGVSATHTHLHSETLKYKSNVSDTSTQIQQGIQIMLWPNRVLSLRKTTMRKLFGFVALIGN